jgi:hypothetical protein
MTFLRGADSVSFTLATARRPRSGRIARIKALASTFASGFRAEFAAPSRDQSMRGWADKRSLAFALLVAGSAACNPNAERSDAGTTTSTGTGTTSASTTEWTHSFSGPETVDCNINPCPCGKGSCPIEQCVEEICVPPDCMLGAENCPCHSDGACDAGLTCSEDTCVVAEGSSGADATSGTSTGTSSESSFGGTGETNTGSTTGTS